MGLLRFDHFMEHALYHPQEGYYARKIATVGAEGDFSTAATLSNGLAKAVAEWIQRELKVHSFKKCTILEIGAGSGQLMLDVQVALPFLLRRRLRFGVIEKSEPLKKIQVERLPSGTCWYEGVNDGLASCDGNALIFSNELVDAFPVRVFKKSAEGYDELYINTQQRSEIFQHAEQLPDSSYFSEDIKQGCRFEVHESFRTWQQEWAGSLRSGSILTIDYGNQVGEQLHTHPRGSLRGYLRHQMVRGDALYQSVGHQDLTADVNFSDLKKWGELLGLKSFSLLAQRDFLQQSSEAANSFLRDEEGAGTAFQVLTQRKLSTDS